jgi:hypothetical protein
MQSDTVIVQPVAQVHLSSDFATYCDPSGSATLTANVIPTGTYTYQWYLDNAIIPLATGATHTSQLSARATAYSYYVKAVSGLRGCEATSNSVDITVKAAPAIITTVDHAAICPNGTITAMANVSPAGLYNYEWYLDGTVKGYQQQITFNALSTGAHNIHVKVISVSPDNLCQNQSADIPVTVYAAPVATISARDTAMCAGGTALLSIDSVALDAAVANEGLFAYQWTLNGANIAQAVAEVYSQTMSDTGLYRFRVRVTQNDNLGCVSGWSAPVDIQIVQQPKLQIHRTDAQSNLDICLGGSLDMTATIINPSVHHGAATLTYSWQENGVLTPTVGQSATFTPAAAGAQYRYTALAEGFNGAFCQSALSNVITVNVNSAPMWTNVHVRTDRHGNVCLGERIDLTASVQGGVTDAGNSTNGIVQWYRESSFGTRTPVSGGVGADTWDEPDSTGLYNYIVTYTGQIGNGCTLADYTAPAQLHGYTIEVHELPTATFTAGNNSIICRNNDNNVTVALEIAFTGNPPFYFDLENRSTGEVVRCGPVYQYTYTVHVSPAVSSTFRILNLTDAYCAASEQLDISVVVFVSDIEVPSFFTTECAEENITTHHTVHLPITIHSGNPSVHAVTFTDPALAAFNFSGNIRNFHPWGTSIEIRMPLQAGDYEVEIDIEGCKYASVGRVLANSATLGGTALIEQRWDDVLTVNNNPANNGNFSFFAYQWYKDGVLIPNATGQYYREPDGKLNGSYHVALRGYTVLASGDTVFVSYVSCPFVPTAQFEMTVYPVPVAPTQKVMVKTSFSPEELQGAVMEIYDSKGVLLRTITHLQPHITLEGFTMSGIYLGRIVTAKNEVKSVKFTVIE